jgi:hypothetical protein
VSTRVQGARIQKEASSGPVAGHDCIELEWICRSVLPSMSPSFRHARIVASFYPYIGLTHTIRRRKGDWVIRISDHCRLASGLVLEAIAIILGCKILRRRPPSRMVDLYDQFRRNSVVQARVQARRRLRGQKRINAVEGRHHDLAAIYRSLNEQYFGRRVEIGKVGWGLRASWRRLGHYDPVHHTITVSPVLDSPRVPQSVVAYLVYHEMLHAVFEDTAGPGRKRHHPPEFRRAERAYPTYGSARKFLDRFCRKRAQEPD